MSKNNEDVEITFEEASSRFYLPPSNCAHGGPDSIKDYGPQSQSFIWHMGFVIGVSLYGVLLHRVKGLPTFYDK